MVRKSSENADQLILVGPILDQWMDSHSLESPPWSSFPQIAVDGGLKYAHCPIFWTGDGDSIQPLDHQRSAVPHLKKTSMDETDLRFTLNYIKNWDWQQLHFLGFLGQRKDHEWSNLGEVCQEMKSRKKFSQATFYDQKLEPQVYLFQSGIHELEVNGLFSVLSFENNWVSISGSCEYQMAHQELTAFSGRGISNVGHGMVCIQSTSPLMVVRVGLE